MQLPHISGVRAAPLSQAFQQGDVLPHFVHHTGILTAWVAISVPLHDLEKLRFAVKTPQTLNVENCMKLTEHKIKYSQKAQKRANNVFFRHWFFKDFIKNVMMIQSHTYMDLKVEMWHVCHAQTLGEM